MNLTQSSNPVFGKNTFGASYGTYTASDVMTVKGTINKTMLMFVMVVASAFFVWNKFFGMYSPENPLGALSAVKTYMLIGGIGGFVLALIATFSPRNSGFLVPIYAILEGMFLGGLSAMYEAQFTGLVIRAVMLTFSVFFVMLIVYRQQIIKVTDKFRRGMVAALGGLMLVYIVSWIGSLFGANFSFIQGAGSFGLIFSLIVVGIAAFSLLLDFDFIERGAQAGAPKHMEWYGAFGLMVSLIWLYINILRLLSIFARRD